MLDLGMTKEANGILVTLAPDSGAGEVKRIVVLNDLPPKLDTGRYGISVEEKSSTKGRGDRK